MENSQFVEAITLGTNQGNRVAKRFAMVTDMLSEVLGDQEN
jgi:hypothetical protein